MNQTKILYMYLNTFELHSHFSNTQQLSSWKVLIEKTFTFKLHRNLSQKFYCLNWKRLQKIMQKENEQDTCGPTEGLGGGTLAPHIFENYKEFNTENPPLWVTSQPPLLPPHFQSSSMFFCHCKTQLSWIIATNHTFSPWWRYGYFLELCIYFGSVLFFMQANVFLSSFVVSKMFAFIWTLLLF